MHPSGEQETISLLGNPNNSHSTTRAKFERPYIRLLVFIGLGTSISSTLVLPLYLRVLFFFESSQIQKFTSYTELKLQKPKNLI